MRFDRVQLIRMSQRVADKCTLPVIEHYHAAQLCFESTQFPGFALDIPMKLTDRSADNFEVIEDEVGQIVLVRFGV